MYVCMYTHTWPYSSPTLTFTQPTPTQLSPLPSLPHIHPWIDNHIHSYMLFTVTHTHTHRLDTAKTTLLPQLIELTNDEEPSVKSAAIEALLDLVTFLDKSMVTDEVVPIMRRFCEWACGSNDNEAVLSVAKLMGRICHELKGKVYCSPVCLRSWLSTICSKLFSCIRILVRSFLESTRHWSTCNSMVIECP